jgi:ketosteroid isomerase-like protein
VNHFGRLARIATMKKFLTVCALLVMLAITIRLAASAQSTTSQDTADITKVMDAYHQAVVAHNGMQLAALFVPQGGAWFNVLSDEAYAAAKAKNPNAPKIRPGSFSDFEKFVSTTKDALDPTHTNLQIHTDGTIATAYFDFVFLINRKPENHGSETWQFVKGADGWRIAAITYSSNPSGN